MRCVVLKESIGRRARQRDSEGGERSQLWKVVPRKIISYLKGRVRREDGDFGYVRALGEVEGGAYGVEAGLSVAGVRAGVPTPDVFTHDVVDGELREVGEVV